MGLITKAGYEIPPYVIIGLPVLLALWAWRRTVRMGRAAPVVAAQGADAP
jgi:hypothetical protein